MTWRDRIQAWLFGAPEPEPYPAAPLVHEMEREIVSDVLYAADVRLVEASQINAIAIAARRYVLAIQRHDDECVDVRVASAVENRLRKVLHEALGVVPGLPPQMVPVVGREIVVRFSGLEVGPG